MIRGTFETFEYWQVSKVLKSVPLSIGIYKKRGAFDTFETFEANPYITIF
jgi:hypothetical protein